MNVIRETALEFIARKDSVDVAKAMFDACYEGRYEEEQIYTALKNLADFNCKAIVIEGEDRKIQAAVLFFLAPDAFLIELVAHEHFLCVLPQWRHKRSHFKILLEALIGWSHEMGLRKLFVSSINQTPRQRQLYYKMLQRRGFREHATVYEIDLQHQSPNPEQN